MGRVVREIQHWKVDVIEPYYSNTVELNMTIEIDPESKEVQSITVTSFNGIKSEARKLV